MYDVSFIFIYAFAWDDDPNFSSFFQGYFFSAPSVSVVPGCTLYPDDAIFNGKKANRTKGYDVSCEGRNTP